MQHMTMFKRADNELGYVMCVIRPDFKGAFESMGFVDSVDKLPKKRATPKKAKTDDNNEG